MAVSDDANNPQQKHYDYIPTQFSIGINSTSLFLLLLLLLKYKFDKRFDNNI
jgi:hypothetical protein